MRAVPILKQNRLVPGPVHATNAAIRSRHAIRKDLQRAAPQARVSEDKPVAAADGPNTSKHHPPKNRHNADRASQMYALPRGARHPHPTRTLRALAVGAAAGVAVGLMVSPAVPAAAPVRVLSKAGDWQAFAGIIGGHKVCGMSTKGNGRSIDIRYFEGDSKVTIQVAKDSWKVSDSTKADAALQLDAHPAFTGQAATVHPDSGGTALQFTISSKSVVQFTQEFVGGKALAVHFPKAPEFDDWQADISASQKIAQTWASCLSAMDNVE